MRAAIGYSAHASKAHGFRAKRWQTRSAFGRRIVHQAPNAPLQRYCQLQVINNEVSPIPAIIAKKSSARRGVNDKHRSPAELYLAELRRELLKDQADALEEVIKLLSRALQIIDGANIAPSAAVHIDLALHRALQLRSISASFHDG